MKTTVKITTEQECPTCKGEGEEYNPEYAVMTEAYDEWKRTLGRYPTPEEDNYWQDTYWLEQGYERHEGLTFVQGPWDVRKCENCDGTGTETRTRKVDLVQLHALMQAELVEYRNNYRPEGAVAATEGQ